MKTGTKFSEDIVPLSNRKGEFANSAILDLDELHAWYAEQQSPDTGQRLIAEIVAKTGQLDSFPQLTCDR